MKLVWCPDTASKSYIDAVRSLSDHDTDDLNEAELIAAMAGGWRSQTVVQALTRGGSSIAIAVASAMKHTGGRLVIVGESEDKSKSIEGVDFMVMDMRRKDLAKVMKSVKVGGRGMVVVCVNMEDVKGKNVIVREGMRLVRKVYLQVGKGIEILHIGSGGGAVRKRWKWIKHVDRATGYGVAALFCGRDLEAAAKGGFSN